MSMRPETDSAFERPNDRRSFLKSALTGGVAAALPALGQAGQKPTPAPATAGPPPAPSAATTSRPGSDYMVDVIKSLGLKFIAAVPGSSFRGLHESVINYGANNAPELLTCLHEESSVAIAVGYARAAGEPMGAFVHSVVGLQHASMSIYHAFADRCPVMIFCGNIADVEDRRPYVEWLHSAQDNGAMVRDCLKWDDQPASLTHFAESAVRGYSLACAVPNGPVLITTDLGLQEEPVVHEPAVPPRLTRAAAPVADPATVEAIARQLVAAQAPVILADRYARTDAGMALLVQLAELLAAPVCDLGGRLNFPTDHCLNQTRRQRQLLAAADVILALEPIDLWGAVNRFHDQLVKTSASAIPAEAKIFVIAAGELLTKSNYQEIQRYLGVEISATADAEATLPGLIDAVRRNLGPSRASALRERAEQFRQAFAATWQRDLASARVAWESSPITTGRLCLELWDLIKNEDWVLASNTASVSFWPDRLWSMNRPYQHVRGFGAAGVGTGIGVAVGVALAHRGRGRIVVDIQSDGDLMFAPGALWTAAHHKIPMLIVMHNNRAYHQEVMHIQKMANRHERGIDRAGIGTRITNPDIDFAKLAQSVGVWSEGPVHAPGALGPALRRALPVVKSGSPALIDVITQPR